MMIRRFRLLAAVALVAGACGGRQQPASTPQTAGASSCQATAGQITIATGNSTGVYYVLGGGLASLISAKHTGQATAAETGASVQNIQQLVAGEYDVAFSLADTAADAVRGEARSPHRRTSRLALIYSNPVYTEGTVPASAYSTPADVKTIVVPNLLLVRKDFPAENACAITRLIFDKKAGRAGARCPDRPGPERHQLTAPSAVRKWAASCAGSTGGPRAAGSRGSGTSF